MKDFNKTDEFESNEDLKEVIKVILKRLRFWNES